MWHSCITPAPPPVSFPFLLDDDPSEDARFWRLAARCLTHHGELLAASRAHEEAEVLDLPSIAPPLRPPERRQIPA